MARAADQGNPGIQVLAQSGAAAAATDQPKKATRDRHATGRHYGPYGVSFNGQNPDGSRAPGLTFERRWTRPGVHPYDEIRWETRTASIGNESGKVVFEQKDVEVPEFWSQLATNVVVSKYFRGHLGTRERETSVRQLIDRVVNTISAWAETQHYFATDEDLRAFQAELTHLLVHQKMAFNSPVWFNVGIEQKPQCSACFINSVQDSMSSIMDLAKTEAMLFKFGSGAGSNLSPIRSSREKMSGGGTASGPVSFMKGYDAFAGVVKSGGKTRRAAKMVILDADHPDILDFIDSKMLEEKKAWALIEQGYDPSFTGEAYGSVFFQNANHSVRVTDEFMNAVVANKDWTTHAVVDDRPMGTYKAADIFRRMAEAAHLCGDPGIQYDSTINDWHTSANTDRIYASNPCSEYMFLNDTACFAPETRISTPDGLRTVEELYRAQERGESVCVTTDLLAEHDHRRMAAHRPALVTLVGDRQVYRLTLRDGRSIRATGDHRFLTDDGTWKRVDQLTPEVDRIEVRESGNTVTFESPDADVRRWQVLGWMSADGVFSGDVAALAFGSTELGTAETVTEELNTLLAEALDGEQTVRDIERGLLGQAGSAGADDGAAATAVSTGQRAEISIQSGGTIRVATESGALVRMLQDRYGLRATSVPARRDVAVRGPPRRRRPQGRLPPGPVLGRRHGPCRDRGRGSRGHPGLDRAGPRPVGPAHALGPRDRQPGRRRRAVRPARRRAPSPHLRRGRPQVPRARRDAAVGGQAGSRRGDPRPPVRPRPRQPARLDRRLGRRRRRRDRLRRDRAGHPLARRRGADRPQLQPGQPQPDEVRPRGRRVRRRGLPLRGPADDHRPGDPRRQRVLPDAADRGEQPPLPAARAGLRQPRRAAHEPWPGLRLDRRAATTPPP